MRLIIRPCCTLLLGLAGIMATSDAAARAHLDSVAVWLTTGDQTHLMERQADLAFSATLPPAVTPVIVIDPTRTYQSIEGFGAAMTDASADVFAHDMNAAQRHAAIADLFGKTGLHLDFMRLTIGASDFSQRDYSYDDMPAGQRDPRLAHFSLEPTQRDLLPVLHEARTANPELHFMASPWSAPGWMKTSDSLIGGTLRVEDYGSFARYLTRYVQGMAREGIPIHALTVQNEPGFEPADYPGMLLPARARAALIGNDLGPIFAKAGIKIRILDYDHNWDHAESPLAVLNDPKANRFIAGVAWHCYGGDVAAQAKVHAAFPLKDADFTECAGGAWMPGWDAPFGWMMRNLVIGATRNWARTVTLWNLALDENHGPHLGGCSNCRGVITVDSKTGAITRNPEYYVLAHVSRFVRRGARRIASTSIAGEIESVAFRNPDGSVVLVAYNSSASAKVVGIRLARRQATAMLPAHSAATCVMGALPAR